MMRTILICAMLALDASTVALAPDFSGTWTLISAGEAPAGLEPQQLVVTQTATELTVVRTTSRGESEITYRLDGAETVESNMLGDTKIRAAWDGDALTVTRTRTLNAPSGPVADTSTERWVLEDGVLAITSSRTLPAGQPRAQTSRYRRP
ncbi:MAG: hypothetical protein R2712_02705 [Vicinamibacterales bacterium]